MPTHSNNGRHSVLQLGMLLTQAAQQDCQGAMLREQYSISGNKESGTF